MSRSRRFQFSVRWLFVSTTVAAIVAALVSRIQAPQFVRTIIGGYFIVWAIYLTFNILRIVRVITDGRERLQQIRLRRQIARRDPETDGPNAAPPERRRPAR